MSIVNIRQTREMDSAKAFFSRAGSVHIRRNRQTDWRLIKTRVYSYALNEIVREALTSAGNPSRRFRHNTEAAQIASTRVLLYKSTNTKPLRFVLMNLEGKIFLGATAVVSVSYQSPVGLV